MKKIVSVLVAIMLLFSLVLSFSANAASNLSVVGLTVDADLNTDGTVDITEIWQIEYPDAAEGFTRWIDLYNGSGTNAVTAIQKFDEIQNLSVSADGKQMEQGSGNGTYSCNTSADGSSYDIVIADKTDGAVTEREYVISYTLTGALKKTDGKANFSHIFIGKAFQYTCNNVTVNINAPAGVSGEDIEFAEDTSKTISVSGSTAVYQMNRVYDTFVVDVSMPDNVFNEGALVSYSSFSQIASDVRNFAVTAFPWIILAVAVVLVIILVLYTDRIKRIKIEKKTAKGIKEEDLNNCVGLPAGITPCAAYKMLVPYSKTAPKFTSKKVPCLFGLAVLECMEKGYIKQDGKNLVVETPKEEINAYLASVLNFLKTFSAKNGSKYVIDEEFYSRVSNECETRYDDIAKYLATFYSFIPEINGKYFKDEKNVENYKNTYLLKLKIQKLDLKYSFEDCVKKVLSGVTPDNPEVFGMIFDTSAEKLFKTKNEDGINALSNSIYAMYKVFVKSK